MVPLWPALAPVLLLTLSNLFMTMAWYGHLACPAAPLGLVILASWAITFVEYCRAVPANRIGHRVWSAAELNTIQEVVTLLVFSGFATTWLGEQLSGTMRWASASLASAPPLGFGFIGLGAAIVFLKPL